MEAVLENRKFYVNFGCLSIDEAKKTFSDYYDREPELVTKLNDRTVAGPVTKEEVNIKP